jgi:hypothetical protein
MISSNDNEINILGKPKRNLPMKRIFAAMISLLFLSSCGLIKPSPPVDLVSEFQTSDMKDFKVVDSYQFTLNAADKQNNTTAKWCIAYTESTKNATGLYTSMGMAFLEEKIGFGWIVIDAMVFSEYEQYPASKTSCSYLKTKYES